MRSLSWTLIFSFFSFYSFSNVYASAARNPVGGEVLILGCGEKHNPYTTAGFLHDHDGAVTFNLANGGNRFGVSDPTVEEDVFNADIWERRFATGQFNRIVSECVPIIIQSPFTGMRKLLAEDSTMNKDLARSIAMHENLYGLLNLAARYLAPGGEFIIHPAFTSTRGGITGVFRELMHAADEESSTDFLHEKLVTFDTTHFSQVEEKDQFCELVIMTYQARFEEEPKEHRIPEIVATYRYNFANKRMSAETLKSDGNVQYMTMTFVKHGASEEADCESCDSYESTPSTIPIDDE